jgi:hypothetical protein
MDCFFRGADEYRIPQRAAHTVSLTFDKHPDLILPYIPQMVELLQVGDLSGALKRNILHILQFCEIDENFQGILYNRAFELLGNQKEEIAIRAFSMTVLYNITHRFPDLKPELKSLIESVLAESEISAGVRVRGNKILKILESDLKNLHLSKK